MKKVSDKKLNEEFQEALKYDNSLLVEEFPKFIKSFWRPTKIEYTYQIYHDTHPNDPPYQARYQFSGSGSRETVIAYLHGIINGASAQKEK